MGNNVFYIEERKTSLISGKNVEHLYTLNNFPVHMLCENKDNKYYGLKCDMIFDIGIDDGFVQLRKVIPPDLLYKDAHSNAVGGVWEGLRKEFSNILKKYIFADSEILEIGGGTGKLNALCNEAHMDYLNWDIVEIQPCPVDNCTANFIKGIFPQALPALKKYDILLHTHCLEHMLDLDGVFFDFSKYLKTNGLMIFAIPDMDTMIQGAVTSVVNFEHSYLLLDSYVVYLLEKYGFRIIDKEKYGDGHSRIYVTEYTGMKCKSICDNLYKANKLLMENFIKRHVKQVKKWNECPVDGELFLFGAHITAQFLVAFGLNSSRIEAILDNDCSKIGKYVCGIDVPVKSPKILKGKKNPIVIIPKSPYATEIMLGIKENINSDTIFWVME